MAKIEKRMKPAYINYDEIQDRINAGEINAYDIIFTKDTHENLVVMPDLSVYPVISKIYRFSDIASCEEVLNTVSDTYVGQIVAILSDASYSAYIVNKNEDGKFYVSLLGASGETLDYNTLGNRPIENITSDQFSPIVVDMLPDGIYKINGSYKISIHIATVFSSANSNLFLVEHAEKTHIKAITAREITDYIIGVDGVVSTSTVPTTEWLKNSGYVTEGYVDEKLAALDFVKREEVEQYVTDVVLKNIDSLVVEKIDAAFDERISFITEEEALEVFNREFFDIQ